MNGPGFGLSIQPWNAEWSPAIAGLIDADSDPLWVAQGHSLHGADVQDGQRFRRTLVALAGDQLAGVASVASNRVHAGRLSCAVEVAPRYRRRGVGRTLLGAVRALAPSMPVAGKVRPGTPAHRFAAAQGAMIYQRCPGIELDPRHNAVRTWATGNPARAPLQVSTMVDLGRDRVAAAFVEQYLWVHEVWSPVTAVDALAAIAASTATDIDAGLSAAAWLGDELVATVFAFRDGAHRLEVVAETQQRNHAAGSSALAAALARTVTNAVEQGIERVEFDGHTSDPHLTPLLNTLPHAGNHPLLLMTLDPATL